MQLSRSPPLILTFPHNHIHNHIPLLITGTGTVTGARPGIRTRIYRLKAMKTFIVQIGRVQCLIPRLALSLARKVISLLHPICKTPIHLLLPLRMPRRTMVTSPLE
jgi:hypothetical protein